VKARLFQEIGGMLPLIQIRNRTFVLRTRVTVRLCSTVYRGWIAIPCSTHTLQISLFTSPKSSLERKVPNDTSATWHDIHPSYLPCCRTTGCPVNAVTFATCTAIITPQQNMSAMQNGVKHAETCSVSHHSVSCRCICCM
jgi:hypothetical protein